ncbi:MAG: hypothetical protein U0326_15495 [Polyangiales bacterium]
MKPRPSPRPAPRTLSATPPEPTRTPQSTQYRGRFPALAVALASGALVPACESPQCGDSRADELERHGAQGLQNAGNGRVAEGLRELGVALGLVSHGSTRDIGRTAGAVAPVNVVPPPPQNTTGGVQAPVTPQPPQLVPQADPQQPTAPPETPTVPPPTTTQPRGGGAVRAVTPTQPQPRPQPPHPIRTAGVPRRTTPDPSRPTLDL